MDCKEPQLIDISPTIDPKLAVWPGDVSFRREVCMDMDRGDHLTLSSITTTLHLGTHADAPSHYQKGGEDIASRSLNRYYGPCQVMRITGLQPGERILPKHLGDRIVAPRLLLWTGSYPDPQVFATAFNSLSPDLIHHAAEQGVHLMGIDTPSVDPFEDKILASHQAIASRDMAILEGLVLDHVPSGTYVLIALPLKIARGDAAPLRAALLPC